MTNTDQAPPIEKSGTIELDTLLDTLVNVPDTPEEVEVDRGVPTFVPTPIEQVIFLLRRGVSNEVDSRSKKSLMLEAIEILTKG